MQKQCQICGESVRLHEEQCPVFIDCKFAINGQCDVYGYCFNILKDKWLKWCPQYQSIEMEIIETEIEIE